MGLTGKKAAAILILAAIFIEATLCQASFWTTVAERGTDVTQRAEFSTQDLSVDGLETAVWETAAQTQGEKRSYRCWLRFMPRMRETVIPTGWVRGGSCFPVCRKMHG